MKKLVALIALILGLTPIATLADSSEAGQKLTVNGNNAFQGSVTATNLNPIFRANTTVNPIYFFNTSQPPDFVYELQTDIDLVAASSKPGVNSYLQITGFSIACLPYNNSIALAGPPGYPYSPETTGVGGGTVTIREYSSTGSGTVVGTIVLPDSPHGGPYINVAKSHLLNPYTPTAGSVFTAVVTPGSFAETFAYTACTLSAVLQ